MFYIHIYIYIFRYCVYLTMRNLIIALYGRALMQYITKMSLIFVWNCLDYAPTFFCDFPSVFRSTMPQLCPNYAPTMPQLCPNYAQTMPSVTMPQLCLLPQLCPNYAPTMPQLCPNYAPTMTRVLPQLCPNYAPTMFLQTTDLPYFLIKSSH